MLDVRYTSKFKKDLKKCKNRSYKLNLIQQVIDVLRIPDKLPEKNLDHNLIGDYSSYRECHIAPDWLLIYKYSDNELILYRTGTHSELFNK